MMRGNIGKYYRKYVKLSGTSGGVPVGPICASPGAPMVRFCRLFRDSNSKFAPKFKAFRATNGTNHTFKKARIQKMFTDNQSKQIICYSCCLTKPRKSEAPVLWKIGLAELPKG